MENLAKREIGHQAGAQGEEDTDQQADIQLGPDPEAHADIRSEELHIVRPVDERAL